MRYFSRMDPVGGLSDFWQEIRRPNPYRWPVLAASLAMTGTLLFWLTQEDYFVPPPPPNVTYISTFAAGRSDAEIRQSNLENQRRQDALRAEAAAREERTRELYRTIGRATGLDVDAMEAEAKADKAREDAAEQARLERLFGSQNGENASAESPSPAN